MHALMNAGTKVFLRNRSYLILEEEFVPKRLRWEGDTPSPALPRVAISG